MPLFLIFLFVEVDMLVGLNNMLRIVLSKSPLAFGRGDGGEALALDSSYTGEHLALDSLEQSTTTSRDVRYLVGQTELGAASYRVTTTDQRECTLSGSLSDSLAYSA